MSKPKIYFAEVPPGGSSSKTALGWVPDDYTLFSNFISTKLNHRLDNGNTYRFSSGQWMPEGTFVLWENYYGSHYTFEEFYVDMGVLGYEIINLPLCLSGGNGGHQGLIKYVKENYIE